MTASILLDQDSIKGYRIWIASNDVMDFSCIYARLYRKIMESDDAAEIHKYKFTHGNNVPYSDIDTLIIVDECIPLDGIPSRLKIISMSQLEAKGHIGNFPQLEETDFKVLKLIERVLLTNPDLYELTSEDVDILVARDGYRKSIKLGS